MRDNALSVSGLLVEKIGGPSVKPYQPDGYWENLNFPTRTYDASAGPDQYRRGLYTWWQRSYLHPSLQAFDAPTREECAAERNRSNIPQQALVLLNDPDRMSKRVARFGNSHIDRRRHGLRRRGSDGAWRAGAFTRLRAPASCKRFKALLDKQLAESQGPTPTTLRKRCSRLANDVFADECQRRGIGRVDQCRPCHSESP